MVLSKFVVEYLITCTLGILFHLCQSIVTVFYNLSLSIPIYLCRYRHEHNCASLQIKKIYFYWICPDTNAFEWFANLLNCLEIQVCWKDFGRFNVRGEGRVLGKLRKFLIYDDHFCKFQMAEKGNEGFLEHKIYLTRGWANEEVKIFIL